MLQNHRKFDFHIAWKSPSKFSFFVKKLCDTLRHHKSSIKSINELLTIFIICALKFCVRKCTQIQIWMLGTSLFFHGFTLKSPKCRIPPNWLFPCNRITLEHRMLHSALRVTYAVAKLCTIFWQKLKILRHFLRQCQNQIFDDFEAKIKGKIWRQYSERWIGDFPCINVWFRPIDNSF